jgi:hypothetical protein
VARASPFCAEAQQAWGEAPCSEGHGGWGPTVAQEASATKNEHGGLGSSSTKNVFSHTLPPILHQQGENSSQETMKGEVPGANAAHLI